MARLRFRADMYASNLSDLPFFFHFVIEYGTFLIYYFFLWLFCNINYIYYYYFIFLNICWLAPNGLVAFEFHQTLITTSKGALITTSKGAQWLITFLCITNHHLKGVKWVACFSWWERHKAVPLLSGALLQKGYCLMPPLLSGIFFIKPWLSEERI